MQFKFKSNIVYKQESEHAGMVFSIGDDSNKVLKMKGLANFVVKETQEGKDIEEVKKIILEEYDVKESELDKDLHQLLNKLNELGFLED